MGNIIIEESLMSNNPSLE